MSILILADRNDLHADCIAGRANKLGIRVNRLDPASDFGKNFDLSSETSNCVDIGGKRIDLLSVTGVYCRIALERISECFHPRNSVEQYSIAEEAQAWLSALLLIPDRLWLNSPRSEVWADAHPYNLLVAKRVGFSVPKFRVLNAVYAATEFSNGCDVVIKPISDASFAYQDYQYVTVPDFAPFDTVGTRILDIDLLNAEQIDETPFLLQHHIQREAEMRVTVVQDNIFVAKANVPKHRVDIKDSETFDFEIGELPHKEEDLFIQLTRELGLCFCTFDYVTSADGKNWLVDINPNGNWLWLDSLFSGEISKAMIDVLSKSENCQAPYV